MACNRYDRSLRAGTERSNGQKARDPPHTYSSFNSIATRDAGYLNRSGNIGTRPLDRHSPASQEELLPFVGYADILRNQDMEWTRASSVSRSTHIARFQLPASTSPTLPRIEARETANIGVSFSQSSLSRPPHSTDESTYKQSSNHFMEQCLQSWESNLPGRLVSHGIYRPFAEPQRISQNLDNGLKRERTSCSSSSKSARASSTSMLDGTNWSQRETGGAITGGAEALLIGVGTWAKQAK